MATRYIGDVTVRIYLTDKYASEGRSVYRGTVSTGDRKNVWHFDDLQSPAYGFPGDGKAYDSPEAYDKMAESAFSFASYYTSDNRGTDCPDWAPSPDIADALDSAGQGCEVRRSK